MGVITRSMKKALQNADPRGPENTGVVNEDATQGINEDRVPAKGGDTGADEAFETSMSIENAPSVTRPARGSRKDVRLTIKKPTQSTKPRSCTQATSSKGGPDKDKENSLLDTSSEISQSTRIPKGVRLVPRGARPETGLVIQPGKRKREDTSDVGVEATHSSRKLQANGRRVRKRVDKSPSTTSTLQDAANAPAKANDRLLPSAGLYCIHALVEVSEFLWGEKEYADGAQVLLELSVPRDFQRQEERNFQAEKENADMAQVLLELAVPRDFQRQEERNFQAAEFRYRVRRATPYVFKESNLRNLSVDSDED